MPVIKMRGPGFNPVIGISIGFKITVKEPKSASGDAIVNVAKWVVSIETNPGTPDLPRQKIKIDIVINKEFNKNNFVYDKFTPIGTV